MSLWMLLVPVGLLGVPLTAMLVIYAVALRGVRTLVPCEVNRLDGSGWRPENTYEYYGHWLPQALGIAGFSIGRCRWFRDDPPPRKDLPVVELRPAIQLHIAAHEWGHTLGWLLAGDFGEFLRHGFGWIAHLAAKWKRPEEMYAYVHQLAIARNQHPQIRFRDDVLRQTFYDDFNDPDDPATWLPGYQAPAWWPEVKKARAA